MQHYLLWVENLPRGVLIGSAVAAVMLFVWIWANFGRRQYLVIKKSDATHLIIYELGRIADSLERLETVMPRRRQARSPFVAQERAPLAPQVERPAAPEPEESSPFIPLDPKPERRIGLSMFGR